MPTGKLCIRWSHQTGTGHYPRRWIPLNLCSHIFLFTLYAPLLSCGGSSVVKAPSAEAVVGEKMSCVAVKDPLNPYIIEWFPAGLRRWLCGPGRA
jgi:hypothetical protein